MLTAEVSIVVKQVPRAVRTEWFRRCQQFHCAILPDRTAVDVVRVWAREAIRATDRGRPHSQDQDGDTVVPRIFRPNTSIRSENHPASAQSFLVFDEEVNFL